MNDRSYAVANTAHNLRRQIEDAEAKLRMLERIPARDTYAHNAVIRVVVRPRYGDIDRQMTYVFLKIVDAEGQTGKAVDRWYHTGTLFGRGRGRAREWYLRWDEMVSWLVHDVELETWEDLTPKTVGEAMFPANATSAGLPAGKAYETYAP